MVSGPGLLVDKARALAVRDGVDSPFRGELPGRKAVAGAVRLARLMSGVDGVREAAPNGVEAVLSRTDWPWLVPALRKHKGGHNYEDVRQLSAIKLPDVITPAQAKQCAEFLVANSDHAAFAALLALGDVAMSENAGLPKLCLVLCGACYSSHGACGGVVHETQRAAHKSSTEHSLGRGRAARAAEVAPKPTGAPARAHRKGDRYAQRIDRELRSGQPIATRMTRVAELADRNKSTRQESWYTRAGVGVHVNAASITDSSVVTASSSSASSSSSGGGAPPDGGGGASGGASGGAPPDGDSDASGGGGAKRVRTGDTSGGGDGGASAGASGGGGASRGGGASGGGPPPKRRKVGDVDSIDEQLAVIEAPGWFSHSRSINMLWTYTDTFSKDGQQKPKQRDGWFLKERDSTDRSYRYSAEGNDGRYREMSRGGGAGLQRTMSMTTACSSDSDE